MVLTVHPGYEAEFCFEDQFPASSRNPGMIGNRLEFNNFGGKLEKRNDWFHFA